MVGTEHRDLTHSYREKVSNVPEWLLRRAYARSR